MKILRSPSGFGSPSEHAASFFESIAPLKGERVVFRGVNEPGPLRDGYLRDYGGDTVTFEDTDFDKNWTYPYWEVLIGVP